MFGIWVRNTNFPRRKPRWLSGYLGSKILSFQTAEEARSFGQEFYGDRPQFIWEVRAIP